MRKTQHIHSNKFDWHAMGIRFDHIIHDPRFWAGLGLAILLALMFFTAIVSKSGSGTSTTPIYPTYPYVP